ncbi:MAG: PIN domain-containing protein [Chloroflexota bacterium]|nr:PIN domain-containing protein [Chloroflexota bacterium]
MSVEDFLDTNVFIYLFDETDPRKRRRAESLVHRSLEDGSGCISFQVVQETLNVVTRKLGARPQSARLLLDDVLAPLWLVNPTRTLYARGLGVHAHFGFSYYDSLIVAAALEAGCTRLYSEDLQHGQQVEHLTIQNPFVTS